ncbi:MAG: 50S ribosomal protein L22 [Mycoplasmataceae bacterium]|jgi:ribosomal protein L22|nr:50S ribosomal protein L22 [Mycoplasmataceae bacterium]
MLAYSKVKNIHVSPRKAKLVADLIKGKKVSLAKTILLNLDKKSTEYFNKLLDSAIANATNNFAMNAVDLYVFNAIVDEGVMAKRMLPRAKGRADRIRKRHSHITLILSDDRKEPKTLDLSKLNKRANRKQNLAINKNAASSKVVAEPQIKLEEENN